MATDERSDPTEELARVRAVNALNVDCGRHGRPLPLGRSLVFLGIATALSLVLIAVGYAVHPHPLLMHAEWGPIELAQKFGWLVIFLLGLEMWRRRWHWRDRLNGFWLAVLGYAALFRETDGHVLLNSESLGVWAISYKLTWIMDPQVPLIVKGSWGLVILIGVAALLVPLILIRAPMMKLFMRADAPTVLFLMGVGFLGAGYLADDVLGRGMLLSVQGMQVIEETIELIGVLTLVWSTVLTCRWPLACREQWLGLERTDNKPVALSS